MLTLPSRPLFGAAVIAFAIGFNAPYAVLAATFDYPAILRAPPADILTSFHAGGAGLIWTWYAFGATALLLAPVGMGMALRREAVEASPGLSIAAAILAGLAAVTQAIGLWRWVFVVPALQGPGSDQALLILNAYGGVAIGEHLGQWLTVGFVIAMAMLAWRMAAKINAVLGLLASAAIAMGTGEGLALALCEDGSLFSAFTIAGYLLLTLWLLAVGVGLIRGRP